MPKVPYKIVFLSWIGLLFLYHNTCLAQYLTPSLPFDFLSEEDGLSDETVTCFLQDNRGFMWIGTPNGLNKYDA